MSGTLDLPIDLLGEILHLLLELQQKFVIVCLGSVEGQSDHTCLLINVLEYLVLGALEGALLFQILHTQILAARVVSRVLQ